MVLGCVWKVWMVWMGFWNCFGLFWNGLEGFGWSISKTFPAIRGGEVLPGFAPIGATHPKWPFHIVGSRATANLRPFSTDWRLGWKKKPLGTPISQIISNHHVIMISI